jgi:uncharacterized protein
LKEPQFEWDPAKAAANLRKHGVSFKEAATIFDSRVLIKPDSEHSASEDRSKALGLSGRGRLLLVVMTHRESGDVIRIISARKATGQESRDYDETQH